MMEDEPEEDTTNKVVLLPFDFNTPTSVSELAHILTQKLDGVDLSMVKELLVFYNHGTLRIGSVESNADHVAEHFQVNVTGVWIMLAAIRSLFTIENTPTQFHINLSTPLVSKPLQPFSLYSASLYFVYVFCK